METLHDPTLAEHEAGSADETMLVVLWVRDEPTRAGEVVRADGPTTIGRHGATLLRQRPGKNVDAGPLTSPRVSRRQLVVTPADDGALLVRNVGDAPMTVNGRALGQSLVRPGDVVRIERKLVLMAANRPVLLPGDDDTHAFGEADLDGMVGESPAAWSLRQQARFVGRRSPHVLIVGPSGSGKELVAAAVHRASRRSRGPFVDRNAATLPEGLVDAELFGNIRNYPNPGTPERPGLIGEASGGTLFLDEIGEMPEALQAHLLRVLDAGSYQRIGESRPRKADLRLIAATNRDPSELKFDLAARLRLRISVPGLDARPEDVPLLARHVLKRLAADDPELARLLLDRGEPRLTDALVEALVGYDYTTHVRELETLLWRAIGEARDGVLGVPSELERAPEVDGEALPRDRIAAALEEAGGNKTKAAELLGLRNRHQLARLMRKHGLD